MTVDTIAPVRKTVVVSAAQDRAFRAFTEQIDRWWPRQHHIGKAPMTQAILEGRPGGRWYSTHEDGTECDNGRVLVWDPPGRLVLAWQITADWTFDPDFVTEVEVTFTPESPTRTRVDLEHRNLDRYGDRAKSTREAIDAPGGWPLIMEQFARVAAES